MTFQGNTLQDSNTIQSCGIYPDAVLRLFKSSSPSPKPSFSSTAIKQHSSHNSTLPQKSTHSQQTLNAAKKFIQSTKSDQSKIELYASVAPDFVQAILDDNIEAVADFLKASQGLSQSSNSKSISKRTPSASSSFPPFLSGSELDPNLQRQQYQSLQNKNINEQLGFAIEQYPELFMRVDMLFIEAKIETVPLTAFVDTGAQVSIISVATAKKCNIHHLIDKRFATTMMGVGTQKSVGRIHVVQLQIADKFVPISVTVLENFDYDLLIGIDTMRRHRAITNFQDSFFEISGSRVGFSAPPEHIQKRQSSSVPFPELSALLGGHPPSSVASSTGTSKPSPASKMQDLQKTPDKANSYSESIIQNLMELGNFQRGQVINALNSANGDPELAAQLLLNHLS